MRIPRNALAAIAVLALAGCGIVNGAGAEPSPSATEDKSPLGEYLGESFMTAPGGGVRIAIRAGGGQGPTEEELAKQRRVEDAVATCMKEAGFEYVAVPPEQNPKAKFDEAFKLPPEQFAEQYGYGISTIDWAKPDGQDDSNPNTKIRNALSAAAKKAYDKALNGQLGDGNVAVPANGKGTTRPSDLGCRGKAVEQVYGKGQDKMADFQKFESLFRDLESLRKRIDTDQRVVDATAAWSDCMADSGQAGYHKPGDAPQKVQQKLDQLTGTQPSDKGKARVVGPPSFDKVDAQKLAELRSFEIALAKADLACKKKGYEAAYKKVQWEMEKEFVDQHKAELENFRTTMAER